MPQVLLVLPVNREQRAQQVWVLLAILAEQVQPAQQVQPAHKVQLERVQQVQLEKLVQPVFEVLRGLPVQELRVSKVQLALRDLQEQPAHEA